MLMFDPSVDSSEVIFFIRGHQVLKEMMFTEFEAVLDGVVGLHDFAGRQVQCVYGLINAKLLTSALCCFSISFDQDGQAPAEWNIPLRLLTQDSGDGPDLGGGPIQLVSRSNCHDLTYQDQMWDPSVEDFQEITRVIKRNRLCLTVSNPAEMSNMGFMPGQPHPGYVPMQYQGAPVPDYFSNHQQPAVPVQNVAPLQANTIIEIPELTEMMQSFGPIQDDVDHLLSHIETQHKEKLQSVLDQKKQAIMKIHEQAQKAVVRYKDLLTQERKAKEELKNQVAILSGQVDLLKDQNAQEKMNAESLKDRLRFSLEENNQQALEDSQTELTQAEETIKRLGEELAHLRRDSRRLYDEGADTFFKKLESVGLSFIAFHPGAGHVSVNLLDMGDYLENPLKFAAKKCNISEQDYRLWLAHYENPKCQAPLMGDECCGDRIKRIENPANYKPGISDRCDKHKTGFSASTSVNRWMPPGA